MYKVFFDQKVIFIHKRNSSVKENDRRSHLFQTEEDLRLVMADFLACEEREAFTIFCEEEQRVLEAMIRLYDFHVAAGGIVRDQSGRILLIFRRGKWDLPKGHVEAGETFIQAALRETVEETGLKALQVGVHVGDTWHLYPLAGKMVIKRSVWYEMRGDSSERLSPQWEEDITETKWADPEDLPHFYKNTYLSIAELLTSYLSR
ncbi:MAG: hypothetical protein CSA95_07115 [Bacteroidetes bacterium]|nr:MAG: hypothetical protein CSA95_07115 [Bacteroidota bacterium]PIE88030.1 MAG: hypothetical protein CSA04_04030 [Bacteroidota bacterium]